MINSSATPGQGTYPTKNKSACDVLEYACLNWVTHVQRLETKETFDDRLTALLERFLGSMDPSSLAYQTGTNFCKGVLLVVIHALEVTMYRHYCIRLTRDFHHAVGLLLQ